MSNLRVPHDELDRFLGVFTHVKTLTLSRSNLTSLPAALGELRQITDLNLAFNELTLSPTMQGHDQLMLGTHLRGCRLTPASCADLLAYARRTGRESAGDISPFLLASGKTGGTPEFFPEDVSDNPDLLLVAAPALDPDQPLTDPGALLLRIHPDMGLADAIACIEQWRTQGLGALDIEAQLAQWNHQYDGLIQRLNT